MQSNSQNVKEEVRILEVTNQPIEIPFLEILNQKGLLFVGNNYSNKNISVLTGILSDHPRKKRKNKSQKRFIRDVEKAIKINSDISNKTLSEILEESLEKLKTEWDSLNTAARKLLFYTFSSLVETTETHEEGLKFNGLVLEVIPEIKLEQTTLYRQESYDYQSHKISICCFNFNSPIGRLEGDLLTFLLHEGTHAVDHLKFGFQSVKTLYLGLEKCSSYPELYEVLVNIAKLVDSKNTFVDMYFSELTKLFVLENESQGFFEVAKLWIEDIKGGVSVQNADGSLACQTIVLTEFITFAMEQIFDLIKTEENPYEFSIAYKNELLKITEINHFTRIAAEVLKNVLYPYLESIKNYHDEEHLTLYLGNAIEVLDNLQQEMPLSGEEKSDD